MLSAALLAASSGRSLHLIISQVRTKYSSSNCPKHAGRTKSSIKKRIIVRRTVRSMFGEQTVRPVKNGLKADPSMKSLVRPYRSIDPKLVWLAAVSIDCETDVTNRGCNLIKTKVRKTHRVLFYTGFSTGTVESPVPMTANLQFNRVICSLNHRT